MSKRTMIIIIITMVVVVALLTGIFVAVAVFSNNADNNTNSAVTVKTEKPKVDEKPKVKTYKPGQYKVGKDLPAGEYVALTEGEGYFEITKDSKGTINSILANDIFTNRSIITVSNGLYLKFEDCILYPFESAPKAEIKNGFLPSGMYKVGRDIAAGEYTVLPEKNYHYIDSYVEVTSSSKHSSVNIISNDIFTSKRYITIKDGQYIKLSDAKIKVK